MSVVYSMYDALVSINVPDEKAKAVIDAMEREMMGKLATKDQLAHVREVLSHDIRSLELAAKADLKHVAELLSKDIQAVNARIDHQTQVITGRLILTALGLIPAIVAIQKLL